MPSRNPYAVLGVSRSATRSDIRAAYHALAVRHHPDTGGEPSGDRFIELRQAYELLSDERARRAWDDANTDYAPRRDALRFPAGLTSDVASRVFYDLVLTPDEAALGGRVSFTVPVRRGPFVDVVELTVLVPPGVAEGRRATL